MNQEVRNDEELLLLHQGTLHMLGAIPQKSEFPRFGQKLSQFHAMRIFQKGKLH